MLKHETKFGIMIDEKKITKSRSNALIGLLNVM
jgi:hypothetical protein